MDIVTKMGELAQGNKRPNSKPLKFGRVPLTLFKRKVREKEY